MGGKVSKRKKKDHHHERRGNGRGNGEEGVGEDLFGMRRSSNDSNSNSSSHVSVKQTADQDPGPAARNYSRLSTTSSLSTQMPQTPLYQKGHGRSKGDLLSPSHRQLAPLHKDEVNGVCARNGRLVTISHDQHFCFLSGDDLSQRLMQQVVERPVVADFMGEDSICIGGRRGTLTRYTLQESRAQHTGNGSPSDARSAITLSAVSEFGKHPLSVQGLASSDGVLCSGSKDGEVHFYDVATLALLGECKINRNVVTSICALGRNQFCQTSEDRSVRIWDTRTHQPEAEFPKQSYIISCCAYGGGDFVFTGYRGAGTNAQGCSIAVWDIRNRAKVCTLQGHTGAITGLTALSPSVVASASRDGTLALWDVSQEARTALVECLGEVPRSIASSNSSVVYYGTAQGSLYSHGVALSTGSFLSSAPTLIAGEQ